MINPYKIIKDLGFERLAGTSGEAKAVKVITDYIQQLELPYKLEEFKLNTFEPGHAEIICKAGKFPARPYGLNESMQISGQLVYLNDPDIRISEGVNA